ncbi:hypothetical protein HOD29_05220 [archaeon]|jgi:hypothetical protein|nr:hypothetical protein [archaeon]
MRLKTKEVQNLERRLEKTGPEWTEKVSQSNNNFQRAYDSLQEIDNLLIKYRALLGESDFTAENVNLINSAVSLVFEEEGLTLRPDAKLYPIHPLETSYSLLSELDCKNSDLVISALLHDTMEDVDEYRKHPEKIGRIYGKVVRTIVEGMTTKSLSGKVRASYELQIRERLGLDKNAMALVMDNIDYYVGVRQELMQNSLVRITKSYDFADNALKLSNLDSNPKTQQRLANKYLYLIDDFIEGFEEIAKKTDQFDISREGIIKIKKRYIQARPEVKKYAQQWKYYGTQFSAMKMLKIIRS